MADSFIIIDEPAVTDKKLDTEQITVGANTVERERFIISGVGATDFIKPVAHDATDIGNPMPIGGYASTATPTAVSADGDRVKAWFDLNGRQAVFDGGGVLSVDDNSSTLSVDDGAGSLTVDGSVTVTQGTGTNLHMVVDSGTVTTVTTVGTVTTVTNVVHVDDNAGSLTVDGTVAVTNADLTTIAALSRAEDSAHSSGHTGVMALAVREATATDLSAGGTDGDYEPLQVSATGRLWVDPSGVTLTVGSHAVTNAGTFVVQENGSALTSLQLIDDVVFAEDAAHSTGDKGIMALAVRAASPTERSAGPTDGDYEPLGVNGQGALWITSTPATTGGWDTFMASSGDGSTALTNSAQSVKGSAGKLGGWYIYNPNSSATYVIIYNTASGSVTVGTTNPKMVLCIPATSAANLNMEAGITFDTAISVAATTTGGGSTAPASALEANFWYK